MSDNERVQTSPETPHLTIRVYDHTNGKVIWEGTVDEMTAPWGGATIEVKAHDPAQVAPPRIYIDNSDEPWERS